MLSLRLTSLYHIVKAGGWIEGVCNTGLHIRLLQLLIGVKLLFQRRHKCLTLWGITEFDMVDRHPRESLIAVSGEHKQRNVSGIEQRQRAGGAHPGGQTLPHALYHTYR